VRTRVRQKLFRKARPDLTDGEVALAAVRAGIPPWWAASKFDQNGVWVSRISKDTGVALGFDNLLVLTSTRILNYRSGFFGRIEGLRGEIPVNRIADAQPSGSFVPGRAMTFTFRDAQPLTLVVRWQDDREGFVESLRGLIRPE
jgi:hypothetical protein